MSWSKEYLPHCLSSRRLRGAHQRFVPEPLAAPTPSVTPGRATWACRGGARARVSERPTREAVDVIREIVGVLMVALRAGQSALGQGGYLGMSCRARWPRWAGWRSGMRHRPGRTTGQRGRHRCAVLAVHHAELRIEIVREVCWASRERLGTGPPRQRAPPTWMTASKAPCASSALSWFRLTSLLIPKSPVSEPQARGLSRTMTLTVDGVHHGSRGAGECVQLRPQVGFLDANAVVVPAREPANARRRGPS
jgi:hypothetical protein